MKYLHIVLFAFICLPAWAVVEVEQQVVDAIKSDNYTNALQVLNVHIEKKERELQYLYQARGTRHFYLNELEEARDDYIKALPFSVKGDVERLLGKTYEKLSEPKKAIFYLDKSIELAKDEELSIGFSRYYKGRALAALGKFSEAKKELLKIESNETTKDMMSEVLVMIDYCAEKEQQLAEMLANNDNAKGYYSCGLFYAHYKNFEDAVGWYIKASKLGHATSQEKLAYIYMNGEGVLQDNVEAYAWALCAEINGRPDVKEALDISLGSGQLELGNLKAKSLLAEYPDMIKDISKHMDFTVKTPVD